MALAGNPRVGYVQLSVLNLDQAVKRHNETLRTIEQMRDGQGLAFSSASDRADELNVVPRRSDRGNMDSSDRALDSNMALEFVARRLTTTCKSRRCARTLFSDHALEKIAAVLRSKKKFCLESDQTAAILLMANPFKSLSQAFGRSRSRQAAGLIQIRPRFASPRASSGQQIVSTTETHRRFPVAVD